MSKSIGFWLGGVAVVLLSATAAAADEQKGQKGPTELKLGPVSVTLVGEAAEGPDKRVRVRVETSGGPESTVKVLTLQTGDEAVGGTAAAAGDSDWEVFKPSAYWLGLMCRPVDDALRAQLRLPQDSGLLVERVMEDSPAAKAGIQQHDVLLKVGGKPVGQVGALIQTIDAAKQKELAIELIRGGKKHSVKATPAKRAQQLHLEGPPSNLLDDKAFSEARKAFERLKEKGYIANIPLQFRFPRAGVVLPHGVQIHSGLPGNMSVSISKQGDQPAKIVVKKDDQKWELTENDLDKLPADVRPHVEVMLGPRSLFLRRFQVTPPERLQSKTRIQRQIEVVSPQKRLEKQVEEMDKQIEKLRKSIEELKQDRPEE